MSYLGAIKSAVEIQRLAGLSSNEFQKEELSQITDCVKDIFYQLLLGQIGMDALKTRNFKQELKIVRTRAKIIENQANGATPLIQQIKEALRFLKKRRYPSIRLCHVPYLLNHTLIFGEQRLAVNKELLSEYFTNICNVLKKRRYLLQRSD